MLHLPWFVLLAVAIATPALGARVYTHAQVAAVQRATVARDTAARMAPAQRLAAQLAHVGADPLAAEFQLRATLIELRSTQPTPDLRAAVQRLAAHEARALTAPPDPDHGRGTLVAAFDVAAAARGTLRAWDLAARAARYRVAIDSGAYASLDESADAAALALALRDSDDATLAAVLDARAATLPAPALAAVLARTADPAVWRRVLREAPEPDALAAVADLRGRPATFAIPVLRAARQRAALDSAATLALGDFAPADAAVRGELLAGLDDAQRGAWCAQALARNATPEVIAALASQIGAGRDGPALRHTLLALRLIGTPAAARLLADFVVDARYSAALRSEIGAWPR